MTRCILTCIFVLASAAIAAPLARAQAGRLSGGAMDLRLFRPAVDSKGLLAVDGTDILGAGDVSFGLVLDGGFGLVPHDGFVNDPAAPAGDAERRDRLVDQLFTGTLSGNVGLANVAVVGLQLPVHVVSGPNVTQPGLYNDAATTSGLDHQGLGDIVLHGKVRLLRVERSPLGLAAVLRAGLPTGDGSAFVGEPGPWLWPSLAVEWRPTRALRVAGELGYRLGIGDGARVRLGGRTQPTGGDATQARLDPDQPGEVVQHGGLVTVGLGASLRVLEPVDLIAEVDATQLAASTGEPHSLSVEVLGGIKVFVERNSYLTLAVGAGVTDGYQAPDLRGVVGFVFEPSIGDRDGDGYKDDEDQCPAQPEDFDGFADEDGCPDPDNDRDGILDVDDECPMVPEDRDGDADQDGCPEGEGGDRDGDGLLDSVDRCPDDPEDRDGFQDEEGCPDPDNDADGILDMNDLCPDDPEDVDGWEDADGCPDPDNDADRILDVDDACPDDPEKYNGFQDEDGCPDEGVLEIGDGGFVLFEKVHFATDSARILPRSYPLLDAIAAALHGHPNIELVEIQGHADERGTDEYNIRLTRDRAAAVVLALTQRDVEPSRMRSAGYGERCPVDRAHNRRAWERNRRVEIKILRTTDGPSTGELVCPAGRELTPGARE